MYELKTRTDFVQRDEARCFSNFDFDLNFKRIPQVSDSATKFGFKLGTFLVNFNLSDPELRNQKLFDLSD